MARGGVRVQIIGEFNPKGFEQAEKAAEGLSGQMKDLAKTVGSAFATREVINFAKSAVSAASDLGESINAVNVTFGEASEGILALGENAAEAVGLSAREFNAFAVQFSGFTQQIAGDQGDIVAVTDDLTTRIADFASVMNMDIPEAAQVFQSALAGETEPIRKFGIDLSAAAVGLHAVEIGLVDSASEMTEAEKVMARYSLLMESTDKVAGDFSNTSDSLANQQRVLAAQIDDAKATIGQAMIPALEALLGAAKPVLEAFTALPEGIQQTTVLVAAMAVGLKSASSTLQGFGLSAKTANTSLGIIGVTLGAAITLYQSYSVNKQDAIDKTNAFVDALKAEVDGQEDATDQLLLNELTTGRLGEAVDNLGLSVSDVTRFIQGDQVPALKQLFDAMEDTGSSAEGFRKLQNDLGIDLGGTAADLVLVASETGKWRDALSSAEEEVDRQIRAQEELANKNTYTADAFTELETITGLTTTAMTNLTDTGLNPINEAIVTFGWNVKQAKYELDAFYGRLAAEEELDKFNEELDAIQEELAQLVEGTEEYNDKWREAQLLVGDLSDDVKKIPDSLELMLTMNGDFDRLQRILDIAVGPETYSARPEEELAFLGGDSSLLSGMVSSTTITGSQPESDLSARIPTGAMALGGVVTRPTVALLAEKGTPEMVVPLDRVGELGGGSTVNVTVNAGVGADGVQVGRQIVQVLNEYAAAGGARISANLVA